jgi:hypothetical protein
VTQVGDHGLSCIADSDYAAYALSMQCNALAADEALAADRDALTTAQSRPWINITNTNPIVVNSGGGSIGPRGVVGEGIRNTSASGLTIQVSGMPGFFVNNNPDTFMPPGIFAIGATVKWTLAVATASSLRQMMVYGIRQIDGSVAENTNYTDLYQSEDIQGDGGLTGSLMATGLLDTRAGDVAAIGSFFTHTNNPANDLTIAAGSWRLWAVYLGTGLTI